MSRGAKPQVVVPTQCSCGNHFFAPINLGLNILVSPEDAGLLCRRWTAVKNGAGYISVSRVSTLGAGKKVRERLGRSIMAAPPGLEVDHINCDQLDNRRPNLRLCLPKENKRNRRRRRDARSGFKGVHQHGNRFVANITLDGVAHYLGSFLTPEAAHAAYCEAAVRLHGEFARAA